MEYLTLVFVGVGALVVLSVTAIVLMKLQDRK